MDDIYIPSYLFGIVRVISSHFCCAIFRKLDRLVSQLLYIQIKFIEIYMIDTALSLPNSPRGGSRSTSPLFPYFCW